MWLGGNVTWMTSEMLYDPTDRSLRLGFPWYNGPLLGNNLVAYQHGMRISRCIFAAGAVIIFSYYASFLKCDYTETHQRSANTQGPHYVYDIINSEAYIDSFIGFWILKDLCWTMASFAPACIFSMMVIGLVVDGFRLHGKIISVSKLFWVIGNTAWMYGEIGLNGDVVWTRYLGLGLISLGLIPVLVSLATDSLKDSLACKASKPDEFSSLR
jgi:hypothetical protein